jgi:glucosamine--fructose-6-phosphate aminotransferase (isomerizing)
VLVAGTGTSFHAAAQGAWLLRLAGVDAAAAQSADVLAEPHVAAGAEVVLALTHTGRKAATPALAAAGADVVTISGEGVAGADLVTVAQETSAAYTASHLGALLRLAQLAAALGADLGDLGAIPDAVREALAAPGPVAPPPARLLELVGGGINQWTAAEGALKVREAAYVATEGLALEQFLHGPSVALRATDRLVCLDGGGPWSARAAAIADAAEAAGVPVTRVVAHALPEPLSIFPLTVAVQRIALETAERLRTNPDSFGRDVPGMDAWAAVEL